ncbi:competence protein ComEA [Methylohalomonas lacus]|uniref:Competence protein ComEA n=1 Tax=Methylohalomonas lacus TaxID=398773 RepID=A0AAE3L1G0_9GAMM|nr:ComEA family DNA-binding protein [Methylohalomonas lacus]MCS3903969.1 competence protein ComEA [Methylohalomonas lacus]
MKTLLRSCLVGLLALPLLAMAADSININTASAEELAQMNGVGEARAAAIIEYRDEKGKFTSVEELTEVSGIGDATLEKNRDLLTAGE